MIKFQLACENCSHCKVDENGNDYCDVFKHYLDFVNVKCGGCEYEPVEED